MKIFKLSMSSSLAIFKPDKRASYSGLIIWGFKIKPKGILNHDPFEIDKDEAASTTLYIGYSINM